MLSIAMSEGGGVVQSSQKNRVTQTHDERCTLVEGTVYGVALYAGEHPDLAGLDSSGSTQTSAPASPVLFIKPRNTFLASGEAVRLPRTIREVEAKPALALIFGQDVRRMRAERALEAISGYTLAIDLSEPGAAMLRPPIREKCRDGFLPIGPHIVPRNAIPELTSFALHLLVDGREAVEFRVAERVHSIGSLIEEISAYMTFRAGDVLLVTGAACGPRVAVGSYVAAVAEGIGRLECSLDPEEVLP